MSLLKTIFVITLMFGSFQSAHAQMLGISDIEETSPTEKQSPENAKNVVQDDLNMTKDEEQEVIERLENQKEKKEVEDPLNVKPSNRGTVSFMSTDPKDKEEPKFLFLYYSDFQIIRTVSMGLGCRVRFTVLNGMDTKLSNLSVRLVWPQLNTPVSFRDVAPKSEVYYDYMLYGDGCYHMDKLPNIVVNRCRVRGLTQEECAGKIRWVKKQS